MPKQKTCLYHCKGLYYPCVKPTQRLSFHAFPSHVVCCWFGRKKKTQPLWLIPMRVDEKRLWYVLENIILHFVRCRFFLLSPPSSIIESVISFRFWGCFFFLLFSFQNGTHYLKRRGIIMWEKKYSSHSETIPLLQFLATTAVLYYIHSRWYMGGRDRKTNEGHTPSLKHAHTHTHTHTHTSHQKCVYLP